MRPGSQATFADPVVIELRYDSTLFTSTTPPPDPAKLVVGHADGPDATYADVPACCGHGTSRSARSRASTSGASHTEGNGPRPGHPHHDHQQVDHPRSCRGLARSRLSGEPAPEQGAVLLDERLQAQGHVDGGPSVIRGLDAGRPSGARTCSPARRRHLGRAGRAGGAGRPRRGCRRSPRSTSACLSAARSTRCEPSTSTLSAPSRSRASSSPLGALHGREQHAARLGVAHLSPARAAARDHHRGDVERRVALGARRAGADHDAVGQLAEQP